MEEQIQLLEQLLNSDIITYSNQRKRMFKIVRRFKYGLVILTAASAIVLGLQIGNDSDTIRNQKNIALIIGAVITALTTLMTFWKVEEYWVQNKVIEQQLENFRTKLNFEKLKGLTQGRTAELFSEYQGIVGQQQSYWKTALEDRNDNETKPKPLS